MDVDVKVADSEQDVSCNVCLVRLNGDGDGDGDGDGQQLQSMSLFFLPVHCHIVLFVTGEGESSRESHIQSSSTQSNPHRTKDTQEFFSCFVMQPTISLPFYESVDWRLLSIEHRM